MGQDEYLCLECKRYGKYTTVSNVHHVNPLLEKPDLRLNSCNLVSLCNGCHDKMHDRVTDTLTNRREQWRKRVTPLNHEFLIV